MRPGRQGWWHLTVQPSLLVPPPAAKLAVDAVLRLKDSANLDYIQIIKKPGGSLQHSYLEEGFILDKKIGVGQPKRVENARILIANTSMDTDKIKVRMLQHHLSHTDPICAPPHLAV